MSKIPKIQTTANKGEWAEFYAHLKIICDQTIPAGDKNLESNPKINYPILAIFKKNLKYLLVDKQTLQLQSEGNINQNIQILPVRNKLSSVFDGILSGSGNGAFSIIDGLQLSQYLQLPITNSQKIKSDIDLELEDPNTQSIQKLGFSIKSKITAEATLVNASLQTRFKFKLKNVTPEIIKIVNSTEGAGKIRKRIELLNTQNVDILSIGSKSSNFKLNLTNFDSVFDVILGQMLLLSYCDQQVKVVNTKGTETTKLKSIKNILSIAQSSQFYEYLTTYNLDPKIFINKLKDFLIAFALGMEPVKQWSGIDDVDGGIIWVKKDGSMVCHHLFERKELKEYLFNNTFFETPSTSRHQFGFIYQEEDHCYFDLCLQIRFK